MNTATRIRTAGIYIPLLTGTLSVIGSGTILYSIWMRRSTKLKDPQHRILGMMSIFDVLYSINKALMFLTYPAGLGVPTFGNDATCSLQGFFTQFGYATGSYNLVLSLYYYLIINRGMKKEEFARVWEKVLHGIVITFHLSFAIIGVSIGLFNPAPGFCYIAPGPYGCKNDPEVPCRFENTAAYFYEVFAQGWIQLAYVVIIVTNLLIWLFVRKQEKEMKKYRIRSPNADGLSDMEEKNSYARSVFIQSILYVGAFILTWSWATIYHLVAWITGKSVSWIALLINTFLPLQGFFNAFIYVRPRYIRLKKKHENLGFWQLVKLVFLPDDRIKKHLSTRAASKSSRTSNGVEDTQNHKPTENERDSTIFKTFLSRLHRKHKVAREASENDTNENEVTWSDNRPAYAADEEVGNVEIEEESNGIDDKDKEGGPSDWSENQ